jgi:hypothetical protein
VICVTWLLFYLTTDNVENRVVVSEEDLDECTSDQSNCDPYARCVNLQPGFSCTCSPPYIGNGTYCSGSKAVINTGDGFPPMLGMRP